MEPAATKRPPTVNKASKYETNYLGSRDNEYHDIWQKNARDTQVKPNCLCSSINKIKNVITFQINTEMENNTQHHFLIRSRALSRLVWCFRIPDALTIFN